ncbi:MAG: ORF6N domain-containing protein [Planctomycetota bacterium]
MIRGLGVMLDADLAEIYGVSTKRLNEQVKRNRRRFPHDFMFRLTSQVALTLNRSQVATGSQKHRDPRHRPYAFTEHGAVMLASVLNTAVAVEASLLVVRALVKLRQIISLHTELSRRLTLPEHKYAGHDEKLREVLDLLRQLMPPAEPEDREPIGFPPPKKR